MPKFASVSQILSLFGVFFFFFFCLMWLDWDVLWVFFKELEPIAIISVKKVVFGWISGLNEAKTAQKCSEWSIIQIWYQ